MSEFELSMDLDPAPLLAALQQADSFFPAGGTAFSWGLEAAVADGHVASPADVEAFLADQLTHRWASCDRAFLVAAYRAGGDLDAVAGLDRALARMTWARELREGAGRAGQALLGVHARLGLDVAVAYRAIIASDAASGQLPVVQGLVWSVIGIAEGAAAAMSAYGLSVSVASAALRLGVLGHIDAQRILAAMREPTARLLALPPPTPAEAHSFVPLCDIAAMRHETQDVRLFAN